MILDTLLTTQEILLNRLLRMDPEALDRLPALAGKVVKIELNRWTYYWQFRPHAICLLKDYSGPIDLVLRGSIMEFMQLAFLKPTRALTAIPIAVTGDMVFAQAFKQFFADLSIDWEEFLAQRLGDTLAYPLAQFLKSVSAWAKQSVQRFGENITDYLQIESNLLVYPEELEDFYEEITQLNHATEHLQRRIQHLQGAL